MLEIELKYRILHHEDYVKILENLDICIIEHDLLNIYIDTIENILKGLDISARLRLQKTEGQITCIISTKSGSRIIGNLFTTEENERPISWEITKSIIDRKSNTCQILALTELSNIHIPGNNIYPLAYCLTNRKVYSLNDLEIIMDKIEFADNTIEYEIECETEDPKNADIIIKNFLEKLDISHESQTLTKRKRAFIHSIKNIDFHKIAEKFVKGALALG